MNWHVPRKADGRIDLTPKRHHGFSFFIMICGFLLPPLAVAVRFGIGKDFFINCICTLCGYIPGHGHNFFIQNIRNNENQARTPKWARRYGLVSDENDKALQKQRAWVGRYNEQSSTRQMYDDEGNVYTYDRSHRFEDGDQIRKSDPAGQRQASNSEDGVGEQFYDRRGHDSADRLSLRRSKSKSSLRSFGRRSAPEDGMLPGAAEAERRRVKGGKGLGLPSFVSRKGKADRHTRSERVMHDSDYVQQSSPYDNASIDSIDGTAGGGRANHARRSSFEGPEDADDNVGKYYTRTPNGSGYNASADRNRDPLLNAKVVPSSLRTPEPVVDIMNDNHQF